MSKKLTALAIFDRGAKMLAEATTVQQTKELKDLGITAAEWARRKGMGDDAVAVARAFALDAERQMGRLLEKSERAKGSPGNQHTGKVDRCPQDTGPTLKELGITKKESSAAQKLAGLPKKIYGKIRDGIMSRTQASRLLKKQEIAKKVDWPDGKYRVIYADPPWSYGNTQPDYHTEQRDHYPVMTLKEICDLPVKDMALDDAVLFLWVTSPILEESFQVIKAWGFDYKASFVWDKVKHNMGHYNSVRHEFLLICVRGSCQPDVQKLYDSVVTEARTEHSKKPAVFYKMIETLYPHGKRIELFARAKRKGWKAHGHESS